MGLDEKGLSAGARSVSKNLRLSRIIVRECGHGEGKAAKPSEEYARFENLAKQLISVPKTEIDECEAGIKSKESRQEKKVA